jgi:serine/threonine protein kinase
MPLYMAPEMYNDADYTAAVNVYSFVLIVYEVFVGKPVFPATTMPPVLFRNVSQGDRPPLPASMNGALQELVRRGWSVNPGGRSTIVLMLCGGFGSR